MPVTHHDWRGLPIKVGVSVIYHGRRGSSTWVTEANVIAVEEKSIRVQPTYTTQVDSALRPVSLSALGTVTVIPKRSSVWQ